MKNFSEASGIQGFSSPASNQHYIIFAANKHLANHVSGYLTFLFRDRSKEEFSFRYFVGSYKGIQENSWMIKANDWNLVKHLCEGEESILYLGRVNSCNHHKAELLFLNGDDALEQMVHQDIGHMVEVGKNEALAQNGYSMGFSVNSFGKIVPQYWTCYQLDIHNEPIRNSKKPKNLGPYNPPDHQAFAA